MNESSVNKCASCKEFLLSYETTDEILKCIYSLPIREYAILLYHFVEDSTIEKMGKKFQVTRERIRQILYKAIKRLYLHFKRKNIQISREELILFFKNNQHKLVGLEKKEIYVVSSYESFSSDVTDKKNQLLNQRTIINDNKVVKANYSQVLIEDSDLSLRTIKCLTYNGIKTVADLSDVTEEQLLNIKNLGRRSIGELKEYLNGIGSSLKI